jgi:CHAT domain-containing protein/Tfp pilus assembly protein PilF
LLIVGISIVAFSAHRLHAQDKKDLTAAQKISLHFEANRNSFAALQLEKEGKYAEAVELLEKALAALERLYPPDKYPNGHEDLASGLDNLGAILGHAGYDERCITMCEKALAMRRRLYPLKKFPRGHDDISRSLNNLASHFQAQGEFARALPYFQESVDMMRRLHGKDPSRAVQTDIAKSLNNFGAVLGDVGEHSRATRAFEEALAVLEKFSIGDHDVEATVWNNLGYQLDMQGEFARAGECYERSLAMYERLFPKDKFPQGHTRVAFALNNLGQLYQEQGKYAQALPYLESALKMHRRLFPDKDYPNGHTDVATDLNNLGVLLGQLGRYEDARARLLEALQMRRKLYPKDKFPSGHPGLANSLNSLGNLLAAMGDLDKAQEYMEEALVMRERQFPVKQYPRGNPELAVLLANLGTLHSARGDSKTAVSYFDKALEIYHKQTEYLFETASEAEALNFVAMIPLTRDEYLSASRHLNADAASRYQRVWQGRAAVTRVMERRQAALLAAKDDKELAPRRQELLDKRRRLANEILIPNSDPKIHSQRVRELTARKEKLERELAERLSAKANQTVESPKTPADLVAALPADAVFIDLVSYVYFEPDPKVPGKKGGRRNLNYAAFVLRRGEPIRCVELGPVPPITKALTEWRTAIAEGENKITPAARQLRTLLWEPLAKYVPKTATIYLAPEGMLSRLPWAALPGSEPGKVLLEDHLLAVVPHGAFLAARLSANPNAPRLPADGTLLLVGGVDYGERPAESKKESVAPTAIKPGPGAGLSWPALPGTRREVERVRDYPGSRKVVLRTEKAATTSQLLADLPGVSVAHLATHGFFADASFRSALQLDESAFLRGVNGERAGLGARSPLVLSGLVFAGANLKGKDAPADGGIVTGEALAGMDLSRLQLAVLSACETGLGDDGGGEGVFGLQRAIHLAGAKNVVATLWRVNDDAAALLMTLFYYKLWKDKKPILEALREAQLSLYHHPELLPKRSDERAPDLSKFVKFPAFGTAAASGAKAPIKSWAGYFLSGDGRLKAE